MSSPKMPGKPGIVCVPFVNFFSRHHDRPAEQAVDDTNEIFEYIPKRAKKNPPAPAEIAPAAKSPRKNSTSSSQRGSQSGFDDDDIVIEVDPSQQQNAATSLDWIETRPATNKKLPAAQNTQSQSQTQEFAIPSSSARKGNAAVSRVLWPEPPASPIVPTSNGKSELSLTASQLEESVLVLDAAKWAAHESLLKKQLGDQAQIVNITYNAAVLPWQKLSPKYGHGSIPVRHCSGRTSMSVEGIFEALKIINGATDETKLTIQDGKHIRRKGTVAGWSRGFRDVIIQEAVARKRYFAEPYKHQLEGPAKREVNLLKKALDRGVKIVILDEHTCPNINDLSRPVSAGHLLKKFLLPNQNPSDSSVNETIDALTPY